MLMLVLAIKMVKQNSLKSFKHEGRLAKFLEEFFEGKHLLLRLDTLLAMEERLANEMVQLLGSSKKAQNSCKNFMVILNLEPYLFLTQLTGLKSRN